MFTDIRVNPMRTNALSCFLACFALLLAGCGGGSGSGSFQQPGGGVTPVASSLVVTSSISTLPSDGSASATITALVKDANNVVLKDVPVTLSTSSGALSAGSGSSDSTGY